MRLSCALALGALLSSLGARAQPDGQSAPGGERLAESLRALLDERLPDGGAVVGTSQRAYLAGLPPGVRKRLGEAADKSLGGPQHLNLLLSLGLSAQGFELLLEDNCILCHTDVDNQKPRLLLSLDPDASGAARFMNLKEFVNDVHFRRGLSCAGCHGGKPADELMGGEIAERWPAREVRLSDRTWVPDFCARCHADPAFMRGFNPGLPTDQLAKYKESRHGLRLLQRKDSKAAECTSCHGAHGIRGPKSRQSLVHPQRIPETCGACHADPKHMAGYQLPDGGPLPTNQLEEYRASVHGRALLEKGELSAAVCNDCHGNHAAMPPAVASISQVCRTCHTLNGQLFDGSKHKQAFVEHGWPECEQCHGKHAIARPSEEWMAPEEGRLCHDCHQRSARDNAQCDQSASYFRTTLVGFRQELDRLNHQVDHLAERGLDVEQLASKTNDLKEAAVQSRTHVHAFDRGAFDSAAQPGREAQVDAERIVVELSREYDFRRNGLLLAIGAMGFLALVLYLKVRQLERKQ